MVAFKFEDTLCGNAKLKLTPKRNPIIGDVRFRQLFTDENWNKLPPPVRQRFGRRVQIGDAIVYRGHVEHNIVNHWGRWMNNLLRLVGAPMPLDTQNQGAAAIVTVTEAPGKDGEHAGQIWSRQYGRQDTRRPFPQVIQSAKKFKGPTGIEEHIGAGIGMTLRACVEGKELVFNAEDIFWDIGFRNRRKLRLKLPRWLGPSLLRAGHEELGGGDFVFTLRLEHRWFGCMVDQRVRFHDDELALTYEMEAFQ